MLMNLDLWKLSPGILIKNTYTSYELRSFLLHWCIVHRSKKNGKTFIFPTKLNWSAQFPTIWTKEHYQPKKKELKNMYINTHMHMPNSTIMPIYEALTLQNRCRNCVGHVSETGDMPTNSPPLFLLVLLMNWIFVTFFLNLNN